MNEELQRGILGDFLLEGKDLALLRELTRKCGLQPQHFTDPALRTAYKTIMAATTEDRVLLASDLSKKIGLAEVENCIARASLTILDAEKRIRQLADEGIRAEVQEIAERKLAEWKGSASLSGIQRELAALAARNNSEENKGFSLAELAEPIPEEEDPDALICGGWLRRGKGAILTSVTGSGKSVISLQLAYAWAAGREIFGLKPLRPLNICFLETEDDDAEIAWFRASMRKGFATLCGWTQEEIRAAEARIHFEPTENKVGKDFVDLLADIQYRKHFDLIIINPLQGVCGCNLSDNEAVRVLLAEQIDPIIKSPETACGVLIVHHTNKPTIHNGQQGYGGDQYAEYLGSGASAISNWMRAMLAIMPIRKTEGQFYLIAAKRGMRLGWPKRPDLKCTKPTRIICHSPEESGIAFWLEDSAPRSKIAAPSGPDPKTDAELLARDFGKIPRTLTEARAYATEIFGKSRHRNELAYEALVKDPSAFAGVSRFFEGG